MSRRLLHDEGAPFRPETVPQALSRVLLGFVLPLAAGTALVFAVLGKVSHAWRIGLILGYALLLGGLLVGGLIRRRVVRGRATRPTDAP